MNEIAEAVAVLKIRRLVLAATLLWDTDEPLFTGLIVDVGKRGLVKLERPHLLELLFDPTTAFQSQLHQFGGLLLGHFARWVNELHETRERPSNGLHVTRLQVSTK